MGKTTAIVPMRHNSERIPGKNYRQLGGRPLYHHVIAALEGSTAVDEIVIDTDSDFIAEDAAEHFPDVLLVERPSHLRDGSISMNVVLTNTVAQLDADTILQTHSTNPFVSSATFTEAVDLYESSRPAHDSLFSVTRLHARLWDEKSRPFNHDPRVLLRTQDIPPLFVENSCFFVFDRSSFLQTASRIGSTPRFFEISPIEAVDIDTEHEWELAAALIGNRSS